MTQMNETYLYRGSAKEAKCRDALPLWRESHKANIACREAIEDTIRRNFDGMNLDPECLTPVLEPEMYSCTSCSTELKSFPAVSGAKNRLCARPSAPTSVFNVRFGVSSTTTGTTSGSEVT